MSKFLVVDDSRFSRNQASNALRAVGHEIVEACHGREGLDRLASESFDGVISDMLMPVMTGLEMLRELRFAGNEIAVVICTTDVQESTRAACEELGVTAFLSKPFKAADLLAAVATVARREVVAL